MCLNINLCRSMSVQDTASRIFSAVRCGRDSVTPGLNSKLFSHVLCSWLPPAVVGEMHLVSNLLHFVSVVQLSFLCVMACNLNCGTCSCVLMLRRRSYELTALYLSHRWRGAPHRGG